jgi:alpha-beta hydrolase superfamily lysophospholipase
MEHSTGTLKGHAGLDLFYQAWRPGAAPKAVLAIVHGHGEHGGRYMNVVNGLVPRGYAVYALDLRGHGRSGGKRGHIEAWEQWREDLGAFLNGVREREPGRPLFVMGHSLGSLVVLDHVLHQPDSLCGVIVSGTLLSQPGVSPLLFTLSRVMSKVWPSFSVQSGLDAAALSRDPAVVQAYRDDPLVHSMGSARLGTELTATRQWVMARAGEWRVPLLMLHGDSDALVPIEPGRVFFERITCPDKERREYASGFHEPHNDVCYEQVVADIAGWLDRHLPSA